MIFATVGTQLPFPRFVSALDAIAGRRGLRIVAQTCGDTDARPHLDRHEHLDPVTFDRFVREASVIVGHAGIGSILSAGRAGKPIILYPRRASLGEHRNEHQLATVAALCDRPGIHIAHSDEELEVLLTTPDLTPFQLEQSANRTALVDRLRAFIAA